MNIQFIIELIVFFIIGCVIGLVYITNFYQVYHAPSSSYVKSKVYYNKKQNTCYKLKPIVHICPISLSMKK